MRLVVKCFHVIEADNISPRCSKKGQVLNRWICKYVGIKTVFLQRKIFDKYLKEANVSLEAVKVLDVLPPVNDI